MEASVSPLPRASPQNATPLREPYPRVPLPPLPLLPGFWIRHTLAFWVIRSCRRAVDRGTNARNSLCIQYAAHRPRTEIKLLVAGVEHGIRIHQIAEAAIAAGKL